MVISKATKSDLKEVQSLLGRTWHHTYDEIYGVETVNEITADWHSLQSLLQALEHPSGLFLISKEKTIDGMAYATLDGQKIMLHQLYVDPQFHGKGKGKALHEAVRKGFPEAKYISLEVEPQNTQAINFYKKLGYVSVADTENCGRANSGISAVIMELSV